MTPSQRIALISDIADSLADQEWSLIDLALRQFGLPWSNQWNSPDRKSYVIAMVESADDETLLELARHLGLNRSMGHLPALAYVAQELVAEIEAQKELMIQVATGKSRIQQVNDEYKACRLKIRTGLNRIGIEDPNPYGDLWSWYGKWSDGSLPTYQSRRVHLAELFQPLLEYLVLIIEQGEQEKVEPTGWAKVDRNSEKTLQLLQAATDEEDFQAIGLLCREAIISLAQAVYDPELHPTLDGVTPSETDAKRMLENYIVAVLTGSSNEALRRYVKNAYQLAVILQHKRTANFRQAALCVEATRSLVNIIAIISGNRDT